MSSGLLGGLGFSQLLRSLLTGGGGGSPAFDVGFNFRGTLAYVTDPAGTYFCSNSINTYPTVFGGTYTGGWRDGGSGGQFVAADRRSSVDPRLAGIIYTSRTATPQQPRFQLDGVQGLNLDIHVAAGDANGDDPILFSMYDGDPYAGGTLIATVGPNNIISGQFADATGVLLGPPASTWVSGETPVTHTFVNNSFYLVLPYVSGANIVVSHLRLTSH